VLAKWGDPTGTAPICTNIGVPAGCTSIGVREVISSVFDIEMDAQFDPRDFTITGNYFGDKYLNSVSLTPTHLWKSFQDNFYRGIRSAGLEFAFLAGDSQNNVWFLDEPIAYNPHGTQASAAAPQTMTGSIIEHSGELTISISLWWGVLVDDPTAGVYTFTNNIHPLNAAGFSSWWMALPLKNIGQTYPPYLSATHNTWSTVMNSPNGAVVTEHGTTDTSPVGQIAYMNNILWNPTTSNKAYKLYHLDNTITSNNVCLPANCDYNDGYNTLTDGGGFTGGANGYADIFSSGTPGVHDLSANPQFVDSSRNVATFDSAYLGNHPATWNSGTTYSVGDMVTFTSVDSSTIYLGSPINYRYTNGVAYSYASGSDVQAICSGANPQPGLFTGLSRACWEFATLYRIRQAVAAQTLYGGVDVITALLQWIRAGYSPTNSALAHAGSDGQDIGAVPVTSSNNPLRFRGVAIIH
jgi:hypothetical protein